MAPLGAIFFSRSSALGAPRHPISSRSSRRTAPPPPAAPRAQAKEAALAVILVAAGIALGYPLGQRWQQGRDSTSSARHPGSLLEDRDASFEADPSLSPWQVITHGIAFRADRVAGRHGRLALELAAAAPGLPGDQARVRHRDSIPVTPGDTLTFSVWCRHLAPARAARACLIASDRDARTIGQACAEADARTEGWQHLEVSLGCPAQARTVVIELVVPADETETPARVVFDDCALVRTVTGVTTQGSVRPVGAAGLVAALDDHGAVGLTAGGAPLFSSALLLLGDAQRSDPTASQAHAHSLPRPGSPPGGVALAWRFAGGPRVDTTLRPDGDALAWHLRPESPFRRDPVLSLVLDDAAQVEVDGQPLALDSPATARHPGFTLVRGAERVTVALDPPAALRLDSSGIGRQLALAYAAPEASAGIGLGFRPAGR